MRKALLIAVLSLTALGDPAHVPAAATPRQVSAEVAPPPRQVKRVSIEVRIRVVPAFQKQLKKVLLKTDDEKKVCEQKWPKEPDVNSGEITYCTWTLPIGKTKFNSVVEGDIPELRTTLECEDEQGKAVVIKDLSPVLDTSTLKKCVLALDQGKEECDKIRFDYFARRNSRTKTKPLDYDGARETTLQAGMLCSTLTHLDKPEDKNRKFCHYGNSYATRSEELACCMPQIAGADRAWSVWTSPIFCTRRPVACQYLWGPQRIVECPADAPRVPCVVNEPEFARKEACCDKFWKECPPSAKKPS